MAGRLQAALGGSPARAGQVQAFLRVLDRDCGPLDFDQAGAVDTCWQRLYFCLRSGFVTEALQVRHPLHGEGAVRNSHDSCSRR